MNVSSSLRWIQAFLLKLHRSGLKKSNLWLIGVGAVLVTALACATHLKMLLSIDEMIDPDFRTYADLLHLNEKYSDKNDLLFIITPRDATAKLTQLEVCAVQKWMFDEVDGQEPFRSVYSTFGVQKPTESNGSVQFHPVFDPQCERRLLPRDPRIQEGLRNFQKTPWGGIFTSRNANDITLSFHLNDEPSASGSTFDVKVVGEALKNFKDHVLSRFPELEGHYAGVALHQFYLKKGLDQTAFLNLLIPVLFLFLFWIFFGRVQPGILFIVTISVSSVIIYGLMAALKCPLDVLTSTLSLMLVLSSLEDFLFIVHFNRNHPKCHWRTGFRKLLIPGFFTSFTTALGFASLYSSDLAIIRRFGIFAAIAALLEWTVVFIALPALMEKLPKLRSWLTPRFNGRAGMFSALDKVSYLRLPKLVSLVLMSTYFLSSLGLSHLEVRDKPANIFPRNHVVSKDLDYLKDTRGWESQISLVFKDRTQDNYNLEVLSKIGLESNVVVMESPYAVENFLKEGLSSIQGQRMADLWRGSPSSSRLLASDGSARSILYLRKTDTASIEDLEKKISLLCPNAECHLAGTLISYTEFGDRVLTTLIKSLGLSLMLVSLTILYLLYARKQRNYLVTIISAMWGPCSLVCIFWIFRIPVTYVTSTFASILVGLAGDNTIQYLFSCRRGESLTEGVNRQAVASVQVCLMMVSLSLIFFGSYFASVRILAPLFILGFLLTLMGDLLIFRGLISKKNPAPSPRF